MEFKKLPRVVGESPPAWRKLLIARVSELEGLEEDTRRQSFTRNVILLVSAGMIALVMVFGENSPNGGGHMVDLSGTPTPTVGPHP